ncbi:MAG: alpha-amylase family glycosyl hydrolase [Bacteroidales bacterium]|nr:alpha-amylase family glycosyl hydrolase [Bacteroidales bacterium]
MKKHTILFIGLLLCMAVSNAQISSQPLLPTATDEVVITFDATQGNGNLAGYTGDIYAHTGVKVEGNSSWQYVIGTWGNNSTQPKLTRVSTNIYTLTIAPSVREFYNVPTDKIIVQMCFVFRAGTGSLQTDDLFVNVVEDGLTVQINSPTHENPFFDYESTISINASANSATNLTLFVNNIEVTSTTENEVSYSYSVDSYGLQWIKAIASDGSNQAADSVYFFVRGTIPVADLPENLLPGINFTGTNEVTLVLNDPSANKEFVFAIGDFSNWLLDEDCFMNRTPDGTNYWVTLTDLDPSKEYIYQYWIDGELKIADPYTNKISDPWNDKYISSTNYPNLIQYPDGKTSGIASVFQIDANNYTWEAEEYTPPAKSDLIIYELHIRDFVIDDDIKTVMEKLDYLETLGVNAIELMPINEFEGNDSWGYNPSFYFAPDKAYGTINNYKQFIDECHKRGIAVIIDMVLNHSFGQSPFVQMYFNENAGEWGQPTANNPWYNQTCPHPPYCWGYDFNHLSPYTKDLIDRVAAYWLTEFKVDGFRFDFTKGFTNQTSGNEGWSYNSERITILKRYADYIWSVNPDAYVILEHFTENSEEKELAQYRSSEGLGMLIWGNINYNYTEASMGWLPNSNFSGVSYKQRGWSDPHLVGYMESHDEERMMYKNITYGNSSNPDHNIKNIDIALKRQKLVGNFFFTIPGPKMIWQFGELGYDISIDFNGRVGRKPVKWDYFDVWSRRGVYNAWAEVIALRKAFPSFRTDNFSVSLSGAGKTIILNHTDMNVVIVGNFGVTQTDVTVTFPNTGKWYNYYGQTEYQVDNASQVLSMEPGEYRIYTTQYINRNDYMLSVEMNPGIDKSDELKLWPNPAANQLNLLYHSNINQRVSITLFDISGKQLSTIYNGVAHDGENTVEWNIPNHIKSGVFIVVVQAENGRTVKRVVIQ